MDKDCVRYDWEKSLELSTETLLENVGMQATLLASLKLLEENAEDYDYEAMKEILVYADNGMELHHLLLGLICNTAQIQQVFTVPKIVS